MRRLQRTPQEDCDIKEEESGDQIGRYSYRKQQHFSGEKMQMELENSTQQQKKFHISEFQDFLSLCELRNSKDRGVCICDCEGKFLIADKKSQDLLEISEEEMLANSFFDIMSPISLMYLKKVHGDRIIRKNVSTQFKFTIYSKKSFNKYLKYLSKAMSKEMQFLVDKSQKIIEVIKLNQSLVKSRNLIEVFQKLNCASECNRRSVQFRNYPATLKAQYKCSFNFNHEQILNSQLRIQQFSAILVELRLSKQSQNLKYYLLKELPIIQLNEQMITKKIIKKQKSKITKETRIIQEKKLQKFQKKLIDFEESSEQQQIQE